MGEIIGDTTGPFAGIWSTWGKLRCPIIGIYSDFTTDINFQLQPHNLTISSGFHPNDGYFLRVFSWPSVDFWSDVDQNPHHQYTGPIVGFFNNPPPFDSFFSIGAHDSTFNETFNPVDTSVNNNLDLGDITDSLIGLTITYTSGTFVTTADAFENNPPSSPWQGQPIGINPITSVTGISTFTPF